MPTVSRNLFFLFFVYLDLCGLLWHIWAYCGLLWPFDDVKTLQEENAYIYIYTHLPMVEDIAIHKSVGLDYMQPSQLRKFHEMNIMGT